jgi:hypothetical protein
MRKARDRIHVGAAATQEGSALPGNPCVIKEFVEHYHTERFHQGLGGQLIKGRPGSANDNGSNGSIVRRSRLGGFLNYYQRGAA